MALFLKRLLKFVISLGYLTLLRFSQLTRKALFQDSHPSLVVLYYHVVNESSHKAFEEQMERLVKTAHPVAADVSCDQLESGNHYVAVTFDDAFACLADYALPELNKRNIPCTIFVPVGFLGSFPAWAIEEGYNGAQEMVMSGAQLRQFQSERVNFGAHTVTHPRLTVVDEVVALREITESKAQLEQILGQEVTLFAFPYGDCNARVIELVKQAGYRRAFTIVPQMVHLKQEVFSIGRVSVTPKDWWLEFLLKSKGAYSWEPYGYALKKRIKKWLGLRHSSRIKTTEEK